MDTRIYATDGTLSPEHDIYKFHKLTSDAQERRGYCMSPGPRLEQWLLDAGFINVHAQKYMLPLGTWPKDKHYVSRLHGLPQHSRLLMSHFCVLRNALERTISSNYNKDSKASLWRP